MSDKKTKDNRLIKHLKFLKPTFLNLTLENVNNNNDRFVCDFKYESDKIRYDEIMLAKTSEDIWNDDDFYDYADLTETEWLIKALNKNNYIDYYELFVPSCWSAIYEKTEYKGLSKSEALKKLVNDRFSVIANNLNLSILDWSFYDEILNIKFDKKHGVNEGLNLVSKKKYQDKIEGNYPDGDGTLTQYWGNGNVKFEHHTFNDGSWWKQTYSENEKSIYYEQSNGYWLKCEYSENGKHLYNIESTGNWEKIEYNEFGSIIYYETPGGVVVDNRPQNINEGLNLIKKKYPNVIEGNYPDGEGSLTQYWENGNIKYEHYINSDGDWVKITFNIGGQDIYYEDSDGYWYKREYDKNGNLIYSIDSENYWTKWEYDENNNKIYYEDSLGEIIDNRPQNINEGLNLPKKKYQDKIEGNYPYGDGTLTQYWNNGNKKFKHQTFSNGCWWKFTYNENGALIYYENSGGYWVKSEYDENGNQTYYENCHGYWAKLEYDENGNQIYYENSRGEIKDNRPQNINEGLNLVLKEKPIENQIFEFFNDTLTQFDINSNRTYTFYSDSKHTEFLLRCVYYPSGNVKLIGWRTRFINSIIDEYKITQHELEYLFSKWFKNKFGEKNTKLNEWLNLPKKINKKNKISFIDVIKKYDAKLWIYEPEWFTKLPENIKNDTKNFRYIGYAIEMDGFIVEFETHYDTDFIGVNIFKTEDNYLKSIFPGYLRADYGFEYFDRSLKKRLNNIEQNKLSEGLNLVSKKKYQDKIEGNYPGGNGWLTQYWDNGKRKFLHRTFDDGTWWKETYNENGKRIYYENSAGYWEKREYDENKNCIYFENSDGQIRDNRPQNVDVQTELDEQGGGLSDTFGSNTSQNVPKWESGITRGPANPIDFNKPWQSGITRGHANTLYEGLNLVSKKKYQDKIEGNYPGGDGWLTQYWDNGNIKFVHRTVDDGSWYKETYDENKKTIYYENSNGYWEKWEYDENGYETYYENSDGDIDDNRPQNINEGLNLVKAAGMKKFPDEWCNNVLSDGTLNPEHLIPKFLNHLLQYNWEPKTQNKINELNREWQSYQKKGTDDYELLFYIFGDIVDILSELAPTGCYYGSTDGDGACIGFWKLYSEDCPICGCQLESVEDDENIGYCPTCDESFDKSFNPY